jgi:hypothetical protein
MRRNCAPSSENRVLLFRRRRPSPPCSWSRRPSSGRAPRSG